MDDYGIGKASRLPAPRGPYGTNEGDIWSGEDSPVGRKLLRENGLILIHEMMAKDGEVEERIYNVDKDNPDPEMQALIAKARAGVKKWLAAQASMN